MYCLAMFTLPLVALFIPSLFTFILFMAYNVQ